MTFKFHLWVYTKGNKITVGRVICSSIFIKVLYTTGKAYIRNYT